MQINTKTSKQWLDILSQITALAQSGLHYSRDIYDQERYQELLQLTEQLLQLKHIDTSNFIEQVLIDVGYATPKLDVRAVIFQDQKILLVKESQDGLWSLPGGWADVGLSAAENVEKEVLEETGLHVKAHRLLALFDRRKHLHPEMFLHVYKAFFACRVHSGQLKTNHETLELGFFACDELPELSTARVNKQQIELFFQTIDSNQTFFD
ncbi:NUDIX hydrolase [Acinetobacter rudis]|uniref:NUDIX hydrolase N-terminal domain-containing protein n=1 Tax=Acinetobacter rudis TaxID=632955 RepID=A0AAW8JD05_9GAMM|nr:NUDIX hydrolase N-terminal domain-containing protein [Acinetobacter rudis]MDQ8937079.1 NUDIX hydrolase N-terminal domain-containing protein [Acinetobacter rudis]MDQ8952220.1 NUDIX hydrolase N-terminal domain-containing protein [Acinetobacter rudis]MDQ9019273.1 NUDIX hydrolase N-terminal domain-containing protein [Acinetobacter rudis]